jgi:hypothetical protein
MEVSPIELVLFPIFEFSDEKWCRLKAEKMQSKAALRRQEPKRAQSHLTQKLKEHPRKLT